MNAYLLLEKTDDECDGVLSELTRFSVRTVGCFSAYAAVSVSSLEELREITDRISTVCPGQVRVLLAAETSSTGEVPPSGGLTRCIDRETGQFDWDCLGSPDPSSGEKAQFFAVAVVTASCDGREAAYAHLGATGGVIGLARLADPAQLLVEFGALDRDLLMQAIDAAGAAPQIEQVRASVAVHGLDVSLPTSE